MTRNKKQISKLGLGLLASAAAVTALFASDAQVAQAAGKQPDTNQEQLKNSNASDKQSGAQTGSEENPLTQDQLDSQGTEEVAPDTDPAVREDASEPEVQTEYDILAPANEDGSQQTIVTDPGLKGVQTEDGTVVAAARPKKTVTSPIVSTTESYDYESIDFKTVFENSDDQSADAGGKGNADSKLAGGDVKSGSKNAEGVGGGLGEEGSNEEPAAPAGMVKIDPNDSLYQELTSMLPTSDGSTSKNPDAEKSGSQEPVYVLEASEVQAGQEGLQKVTTTSYAQSTEDKKPVESKTYETLTEPTDRKISYSFSALKDDYKFQKEVEPELEEEKVFAPNAEVGSEVITQQGQPGKKVLMYVSVTEYPEKSAPVTSSHLEWVTTQAPTPTVTTYGPVEESRETVEYTEIPYQTKYVADDNLEKGKTEIRRDGVNGYTATTTTHYVYKNPLTNTPVTATNGKQDEVGDTVVVRRAYNEIIAVGTKEAKDIPFKETNAYNPDADFSHLDENGQLTDGKITQEGQTGRGYLDADGKVTSYVVGMRPGV